MDGDQAPARRQRAPRPRAVRPRASGGPSSRGSPSRRRGRTGRPATAPAACGARRATWSRAARRRRERRPRVCAMSTASSSSQRSASSAVKTPIEQPASKRAAVAALAQRGQRRARTWRARRRWSRSPTGRGRPRSAPRSARASSVTGRPPRVRRAHEQRVEPVLEQEDAQVAGARGRGRRRAPAGASPAARSGLVDESPARRARPPRAGATESARIAASGWASARRPASASHRSMVCACVSMRPTARAARSSPASARGASASSAAARAASAMPAQLAAVRMASRPNHGSRSSSSGPPSSACTRAPWKSHEVALGGAHAGGGEPRAVDLDALGEIDVGDAARVAVARQHERARPPRRRPSRRS